jgi:cytochrome P450
VLFTTTPKVDRPAHEPGEAGGFAKWFTRSITAMMQKDKFVTNLPLLVSDTLSRLEAVVSRNGGGREGAMDPFDDIYRIVYQLTMRTVGATEIAGSPELLATTLRLFEQIEQSNSPARIIFPWLPTPAHFKRMAAGARLYMIFNRIIDERKRSGRREQDPLQYLLDTGEDTLKVLTVSQDDLTALFPRDYLPRLW